MTQKFGQGFEGLEDRTLLAASVTFAAGTLTITGDGDGEDINAYGVGAAGEVRVTIDDGGGLVSYGTFGDGPDGPVKNIVINGGDGNDDIHVYDVNISGNLTVNGQGDDDRIRLRSRDDEVFIGKNVTLSGGGQEGDDIYIFSDDGFYGNEGVRIGGSVTTNTNGGNNQIFTDGIGDVAVGLKVTMNSLTAYGDLNLDGDSTAIYTDGLGDINLRGAVYMNGGDGWDDLSIRTDNTSGSISINGPVFMTGKHGHDEMEIATNNTSSTLFIGGNVKMDLGDGFDYGLLHANSGNITVTGRVAMLGGNEDDELDVVSSSASNGLSINGDLTLSGGAGEDDLNMYGDAAGAFINIAGNANFDGGSENDDIDIYTSAIGANIDINKVLTLTGGNGNDDMYVETERGTSNQDIRITTVQAHGGNGEDEIGFNAYGVDSNISVRKHVTITGSAGDDDFYAYGTTVQGNFSINMGAGDDEAFARYNTIFGNSFINGSSHVLGDFGLSIGNTVLGTDTVINIP